MDNNVLVNFDNVYITVYAKTDLYTRGLWNI